MRRAAVPFGYAALSLLYFGARLLPHPGREFVGLGRDPEIFVWSIAWWPHALEHAANPFVTHEIWAPDGLNLAWTTSVPGLAVPLAPVTAAFGPVVAYNLAAVALPALAAWTAYLLCLRVTGRLWPSLVGGYVFGFSGYMLGQELGHLHMTAVFLVPLVALVVLRFVEGELGRYGLAWRLAALLGLQLYLSTELFFTLVVAALVAAAVAVAAVPAVRPRLRQAALPGAAALLGAGVLAAPLLAYAATDWQTESINDPNRFGADLLNVLVPTRLVAAGAVWAPSIAAHFDGNDAERGAYLGLPVLGLALWVARRRRSPGTRFLLAGLALALVAALGTTLRVEGRHVVTLPWYLLTYLPGFDNVLPVRLALYATLAAAVLVALALGELGRRWAVLAGAVVVLSLVPRLELPLWSTTPDRPAFFADRLYERCLAHGENLLVVPFGAEGDSMLWQAESDFAFRMAGGYIRPGIPGPFIPYDAVWAIQFSHRVPLEPDLQKLVADKRVGHVVVRADTEPAWRPVLAAYGPPTATGGVVVYPRCADRSRSSSS